MRVGIHLQCFWSDHAKQRQRWHVWRDCLSNLYVDSGEPVSVSFVLNDTEFMRNSLVRYLLPLFPDLDRSEQVLWPSYGSSSSLRKATSVWCSGSTRSSSGKTTPNTTQSTLREHNKAISQSSRLMYRVVLTELAWIWRSKAISGTRRTPTRPHSRTYHTSHS